MHKGFVITSAPYLQPCYRINPFRTSNLSVNRIIEPDESAERYLDSRFGKGRYLLTSSGKGALEFSLGELYLKRDDVVTIMTTSGNYYVSSCVTDEISKFCSWSRKIEKKTKAIIVIHEFGFPFQDLERLANHGIPLIEDCAHAFVSQNREGSVGKVGNFVVYSIPKFFPCQFGGVVVSKKGLHANPVLTETEQEYIKAVLSCHLTGIDEIVRKRTENFRYLEKNLGEIGLYPRFVLDGLCCPSVYMFRAPGIDLPGLKVFMQAHGVESSVFYGEEAFFVPVNQALQTGDLDYFICLVDFFMRAGN